MSMDKSIPYYIAGPMSGIPQFNFPAFDAAAAQLRERGFTIVSPAELDKPEVRARALASQDGNPDGHDGTWGDFLSRDIKIVADQVKGIMLLRGWHNSRGARLESYAGIQCNHVFGVFMDGKEPEKIERHLVRLWL